MAGEIGARIKEIRKKRGLTQVQLAKKAGISQSALSDIESQISSKRPSATTIQLLASALGTTVAELMGETAETRLPTDDEIKFALFGGDAEITDAQLEEVKRFAQFVKMREEREELGHKR